MWSFDIIFKFVFLFIGIPIEAIATLSLLCKVFSDHNAEEIRSIDHSKILESVGLSGLLFFIGLCSETSLGLQVQALSYSI